MFLLVIFLAIYMTLYYLKNNEYNKLKEDTENKKAEIKWFREIFVSMEGIENTQNRKIIYLVESL